ncbi:MAG TPA: paraslipin [Allocoleopsis sp.]
MDTIITIIIAGCLTGLGFAVGSAKIINEGEQALVTRLGKYNRTISPGLRFVLPGLEKIVIEDTIGEKILEIQPRQTLTKDNISVQVNAVIYWQVLDLETAYYAVENVENALKNLVLNTAFFLIGEINIKQIGGMRKQINQILLKELEEKSNDWGIKINRVEIQELKIDPKIEEVLKLEWIAETKQSTVALEMQATQTMIELLGKALNDHPQSKEILNFLVAQKYIDVSQQIGNNNAGRNMTEALNNLMNP